MPRMMTGHAVPTRMKPNGHVLPNGQRRVTQTYEMSLFLEIRDLALEHDTSFSEMTRRLLRVALNEVAHDKN